MGVRPKRVTLTYVACPTIHAPTPVTITFNYRKPATNAFSVRGHPVSEFSPKENQKRVHEKYQVKLNFPEDSSPLIKL